MIDFFTSVGGFIITPLYWITSVVLLGFHTLFGDIFGDASGVAWALSIVGLTLVIRAALIPLFVKQIKSSRNMQLLQPKVKELQKKYGHDRERLAQETMALYKESGTNPFASCLPILLQMPIFLALFRLLDLAANNPPDPRGVLTEELASQFGDSRLFGAQISNTFLAAEGDMTVRVLALVLVVAMTATTFLTQRQLMSKNMPPDALTGPYANQQKMLLYVLPLVFAVGGIAFPIGVLIYWTTSNLWTMGQQFYVIRNNPAPGTKAAQAKADRVAAKARRKAHGNRPGPTDGPTDGTATASPPATAAPDPVKPPQREQPKRQSRDQRKRQKPKSPPNRAQTGKSGRADPDQPSGETDGTEEKNGGTDPGEAQRPSA